MMNPIYRGIIFKKWSTQMERARWDKDFNRVAEYMKSYLDSLVTANHIAKTDRDQAYHDIDAWERRMNNGSCF